MTVLVTGGAGFIGSHVVDVLVGQGRDVRVLDKLVEQVHGSGGPRHLPSTVDLVSASVTDRDAVRRALQGVHQVVHLAAEVGVGQSMYEVHRFVDANTSGTALLLDVLANERHAVSKIVVASSCSIYGEGSYGCARHGAVAPRLRTAAQLREHDWEPRCPECGNSLSPVPTVEDKPLHPPSVYAISKMDQELLTLTVGAAYGIGATALRFFNVYGPRQALSNPYTGVAAIFSSRLLNGQAPLVYEDGHQMRDFVHVRDVARATVAALESEAADGAAINIGTGRPTSILQAGHLIADALGVPIEPEVTGSFRVGDVRHCWADTARATKLLGFTAEHDFRADGVQELVEWVRGQTAEDRTDGALAELARRGLTL
jgi:dTDP-L-rhamnose 4-epimerase